ncbi:hypothetical protein A9Q83_06330 [Alphaproteobacteria bacterium 46_93_T64]|nr:hypothetical protein A9Q83_06330 [Alphaproteobacteria bacterium 46_93_T64]
MIEFILENEPTIRMSFFFSALVLVGIWEVVRPRRPLLVSKLWRWANNLGLTFLNSFILRVIFPILAVGLAASCTENGWGLLNWISLPLWAAIIVAIVLQDLIIYGQHVLFHHVPVLWRLHKMHHADLDYDVTTGARFHPIEICLSMGIKLGIVFLLGPPVIAVILFEIILSTMAMFNHANAKLPKSIDRVLRLLIVTPDMHRVHHSTVHPEFNRNFGFNLSIWDKIFGTYKTEPDAGQVGMTIGLPEYQRRKIQNILWMILLPFRS